MFADITVLRTAREMAAYAAQRQAIIAENVANADTPGYRARDLALFAETFAARRYAQGMRATRPGHFGDHFFYGRF